jgi:hypothetical protein
VCNSPCPPHGKRTPEGAMELRNSKKKGVPAQQERNRRTSTRPSDTGTSHAASPSGRQEHSNKRLRSKPPALDSPTRRLRTRTGEAGPSAGRDDRDGTAGLHRADVDPTARGEGESEHRSQAGKREPRSRGSEAATQVEHRGAAAMAGLSGGEDRNEQVR